MKRVVLVAVVAIFSLVLSAQTTDNKTKIHEKQRIFLEMAGGVSWPMGNSYTSLDRNNTRAGFAGQGYFVRAQVDWMGQKDFGLAFQYTFQHNPLQDSAVNVKLPGTSEYLGRSSWTNHYLLIGPEFMKTISKFVIEANVLAGVVISFSPVFSTYNPATKANDSHHGYGFGLGLGIGLGYNISPRFALHINLNYLYGTPGVDVTYNTPYVAIDTIITGNDTVINQNTVNGISERSFKKRVSTFNAGIGFIYKF